MHQVKLLEPFLEQQGFVMLDGAQATELERRGADLDNELWSAKILIDSAEMIRQLSQDYLLAGADIITTVTYQASFEGFENADITRARASELMQLSVDLAVLARETFWSSPENRIGRLKPLVAASIGPYGAYLADGSEYHGDYSLDKKSLMDFHRPRIAELANSQADLFAFETIPSKLEAQALIELLVEYPQCSAWLSFSCKDERQVCHGETFVDCVALAESSNQIIAAGINCTSPQYILPLLESAQGLIKPLIVYPNSGEKWAADEACWVGTACEVHNSTAWYDAGARMIGGCCRTTPDDTARIRAELFAHLK